MALWTRGYLARAGFQDTRQNLQTKAMIVPFGLFAETKRDLIVERAKVGSGSPQDAR